MKHFYVHIPFDIKSKSNYRHDYKNRSKWEGIANFETVIKQLFKQNIPDDWDLGNKKDPIAKRPIIIMIISAKSRLDAANFSKSIADAAEGVVYHNDKSLRYPMSESLIENGPTYVGFAWLEPGTDIKTCRETACKLLLNVPN